MRSMGRTQRLQPDLVVGKPHCEKKKNVRESGNPEEWLVKYSTIADPWLWNVKSKKPCVYSTMHCLERSLVIKSKTVCSRPELNPGQLTQLRQFKNTNHVTIGVGNTPC